MGDLLLAEVTLRCKHCPQVARWGMTHEAARFNGWRVFRGVSMTGKPLEDVVCPSCSGVAPVLETPPSWLRIADFDGLVGDQGPDGQA